MGQVMDLEEVASGLRDEVEALTSRCFALEKELEQHRSDASFNEIRENNNKLRRTMYRMLGQATGSAFHTWYEHAKLWKQQQLHIKKAAKRWQLQGAMRCLNKWVESTKTRQWLRKFVKRMIGGRDHALLASAFSHYRRLVERLRTENLNLEMHTIMQRCEFLEAKLLSDKMKNNEAALRRVKKMIAIFQEGQIRTVFAAWKGVYAEEKVRRS